MPYRRGAGYDALSRLASLSHVLNPGPSQTDLLSFGYTRNDNGLLTQVTETGSGSLGVARRDYAYDPLSRLTQATRYADAGGTSLLRDTAWTLSGAGDWQSVDINPPPGTTLLRDVQWGLSGAGHTL